MLHDENKELSAALRANASLRLQINSPVEIQARAKAFLDTVEDEEVFGYIKIPLAHLRVCWAIVVGERRAIDSDAALSRAAMQLMKAAMLKGGAIST